MSEGYIELCRLRSENRELKAENGELATSEIFLRNELYSLRAERGSLTERVREPTAECESLTERVDDLIAQNERLTEICMRATHGE